MKIVCLDALTLGKDIDLNVFNQFGEFVSYETSKASDVIDRLRDADIVITNKVLITKEIMQKTNLKLICVSATGTNNIDLQAAKELGIEVKNVAGYSTKSVVQQTFASLLALSNHIKFYDDFVKNQGWARSEIFTNLDRTIEQIADKKFGIIGLGEIGKEVAKVAFAFGCEVYYHSTSGKNLNAIYPHLSLNELLQECDIISIHAPLNENTKNLIGKNELGMMKNGAIIMNFGRGGIVDETELAQAIDNKGIRACVDVTQTEPINADNALLSIKNKQNLIITPHIAWASLEARKILVAKIVQNIKEFLKI